jgi:microcystin-dependent protein
VGAGFTPGQRGGEQAHTLSIGEIPTHTHVANASSNAGAVIIAAGNLLARTASQLYVQPSNLGAMSAPTVTNVGGSQAHLNMQPFLVITFAIALIGIFPSAT